jgi:hypothetical protein
VLFSFDWPGSVEQADDIQRCGREGLKTDRRAAWSRLGGAVVAAQRVAEGGDELEGGSAVGRQGGLGEHPDLRVVSGLIDTAALEGVAFDDATVDEVKEDGDAVPERGFGPVGRAREVVLEMEPGIARGLVDQRLEMFVVAMNPVGGEAIGPGA